MVSYSILLITLLIDLAMTGIIVLGIYLPSEKDKSYVLTFFAFNISIFLVATLFGQVDLTIEFGFGLFAIFSILRYRSEQLPVREMTYLFILMALPVINVILINEALYVETAVANLVILAVFYVIERAFGLRYETRKTVIYEKIELVKPENYQALLADLCERTGLAITRCEVGKIDFLHDIADIKIFYRLQTDNTNIVNRKDA